MTADLVKKNGEEKLEERENNVINSRQKAENTSKLKVNFIRIYKKICPIYNTLFFSK